MSSNIVAFVDFTTKERTFISSSNPEYRFDDHFVQKRDCTDYIIHKDDSKCVDAYLMNSIRMCKEGEKPTMFSAGFFKEWSNEKL